MYKEGHDNHYMSMNKIGVWQCKRTLDCDSTVNTNIKPALSKHVAFQDCMLN